MRHWERTPQQERGRETGRESAIKRSAFSFSSSVTIPAPPASSDSSMASSSISKMEIWQDKQVDDVQKIARDLCEKVKKEVEDNSRTAAERYFIHLLFEEKVEEELQHQKEELKKQFLMHAYRKRKAKSIYSDDIEKMTNEETFWKLLHSSEKKVKFIDALFDSKELKYDSPPGTIAEIAKQLLAIHPLESEEIAIELAKDRVCSLHKMHVAERNYEVQNWLRTFPFITESSSIFDDLKSLKKHEDFQKFNYAVRSELEDYKWFLFDHGGNDEAKEKYTKHIQDSYNLIMERHKKRPYYNEKGILNLAARIVHEGYEIKDVSEEILKLQKMGCSL